MTRSARLPRRKRAAIIDASRALFRIHLYLHPSHLTESSRKLPSRILLLAELFTYALFVSLLINLHFIMLMKNLIFYTRHSNHMLIYHNSLQTIWKYKASWKHVRWKIRSQLHLVVRQANAAKICIQSTAFKENTEGRNTKIEDIIRKQSCHKGQYVIGFIHWFTIC